MESRCYTKITHGFSTKSETANENKYITVLQYVCVCVFALLPNWTFWPKHLHQICTVSPNVHKHSPDKASSSTPVQSSSARARIVKPELGKKKKKKLALR